MFRLVVIQLPGNVIRIDKPHTFRWQQHTGYRRFSASIRPSDQIQTFPWRRSHVFCICIVSGGSGSRMNPPAWKRIAHYGAYYSKSPNEPQTHGCGECRAHVSCVTSRTPPNRCGTSRQRDGDGRLAFRRSLTGYFVRRRSAPAPRMSERSNSAPTGDHVPASASKRSATDGALMWSVRSVR